MPKKKDQITDSVGTSLEAASKAAANHESKSQAAPLKSNKNNDLDGFKAIQTAPQKQMPLDLGIEIEKDINGIEMGVLENGIPYLTQKGLSKVAGIARSVIYDITKEWEEHFEDEVLGKDRISFFKNYLFSNGFQERKLHLETMQDNSVHFAYPDLVCMAFLEYYAFESKGDNSVALENYRKFAAHGLRKFIYEALDYTGGDKWRYYLDRVSLLKDSAPLGYFIVFQETTGLAVDLINADLPVNHKTLADISIGSCWGRHWTEENLAKDFGERIEWKHNYPNYYPQASSNPQPAKAYPDAALPYFRQWFKQEYLTTKFPKYMLTKANLLPGGKEEALKIGNMYQPKQLPSPT